MIELNWERLKDQEERLRFDQRRDVLRDQRKVRDAARRQRRVVADVGPPAAPVSTQCLVAERQQRPKK
jgi:hypothetical protein